MKYFDKNFIDFFKSLEKNNSTTWFKDNRVIQQVDNTIDIKPADAIF